jgi:hypothetical protein
VDTNDFYVTKYSVKYELKCMNPLSNIDLKTNACNAHGNVPISEMSHIENYRNPATNSNITILPKDYFKPLSKCGVYHSEGHTGKIMCVCRYILYMCVECNTCNVTYLF